MRIKLIFFFLSFFLILPVMAGAVSESDFKPDTTEQIVNLCTATAEDPLYHQAVNFCHGYLVGAYDYYKAAHSGSEAFKLVCLPDPPPSRNEAIEMFIDWAKAHPQYMKDNPVETEFRFLMEKWPCKP
jgi:hypothetical protein